MSVLHGSPRPKSRPEELANSLSHGAGLAIALVAAVVLIATAIQRGSPSFLIGASVFAATMVLLYLASTVYHALPDGRAKRLSLVVDHSAIYLFIAGSYTPFTLGVLRGPAGWTLLVIVWALAAAGVAAKIIGGPTRFHRLSTAVYLGMGWLFLIAAGPVWRQMPPAGLAWLLAGGLAYTAGVAFFLADRIRYTHFVWHLFVLTGTACHFIAILWHAA